jgi:hypothetical protein
LCGVCVVLMIKVRFQQIWHFGQIPKGVCAY